MIPTTIKRFRKKNDNFIAKIEIALTSLGKEKCLGNKSLFILVSFFPTVVIK